jgi:hypothetical protein
MPLVADSHKATLPEDAYGTGNTGFGKAHVFTYVGNPYRQILLGKNIYCFKIHFAGFLQLHAATSFL